MPESMPILLRALGADDVDAVMRIQQHCYGADFAEPREVFVRRLRTAGHCSWAAERGGELVAYLAAYWSRPGAITPLNGDFAEYDDASVLYLHDMAVSEAAAGQGQPHAELLHAKQGAWDMAYQRTQRPCRARGTVNLGCRA